MANLTFCVVTASGGYFYVFFVKKPPLLKGGGPPRRWRDFFVKLNNKLSARAIKIDYALPIIF